MLPTLVGWLLRALLVAFGVAAAAALVRWVAAARGERREPWPVRLSLLMLLLAGVYAIGHARLLVARAELEEAFAFLAPRMKALELAGEPIYDTPLGVHGLHELPISFTVA